MGAMSELDAAVADLKAAARVLDTAADSIIKLFSGGDGEGGEDLIRPFWPPSPTGEGLTSSGADAPASPTAEGRAKRLGEGKRDGEGSVVRGQGPGPETSSGADAPPSPTGEGLTSPGAAEMTLEDVRGALADICARGYGPQVKALISKHGGKTLTDVPKGDYAALVDEAKALCGGEA